MTKGNGGITMGTEVSIKSCNDLLMPDFKRNIRDTLRPRRNRHISTLERLA